MLTVKDLSKTFRNRMVVNDLNFTLEKGACTALIGPNGAGKTTTLRMLTGLIRPTKGTITYTEVKDDFRHTIGYLPQYPQFYNWMTGEEFLVYCSKLYGISRLETKKRTEQLLAKVDLIDAKNKSIQTYSGGMKQRLGIAQALIHQPKILFLDEPVSSLDPIGRREVLTLMKQLKETMTILFSTHILNDADEVSDSLIVLKDGKMVEEGTMDHLQAKYTTSKIVVQFAKQHDNLIPHLQNLPSIYKVEAFGPHIHLYTDHMVQAQNEVLQFILKNEIKINELKVGRVSMEEMFVKAVK